MVVENPLHVEMSGIRRVPFQASSATRSHSVALRAQTLAVAEFRPDLPNYVVLPFANRIDRPEFDHFAQRLTARLLLEAFRGFTPDYVVGIANSGLPLARAVNRELLEQVKDPRFVEATNLHDISKRDHPKDGVIFNAHSYSRQAEVKFHLPQLEAGKTALVIDDVLAKGGISREVLRQLLAMGVDVKGFGLYFTKLWEGGMEEIVGEFGIPVVPAIAIASKEGTKITLVPESESLVRYERDEVGKWNKPDVTPVKYPSTSVEDAPPQEF